MLARAGLSRLAALDPAPLPRRYERARPGELLHIDSKKLARIERTGHRVTGDPQDHVRGVGYEAAFVAIDDRSRVGFAEMFADERKPSAAAFLDHAARYYGSLGRTGTLHHDRQRQGVSFAPVYRGSVDAGACGISSPGSTHPAPTAKPSASSRPPCANGRTGVPIDIRANELLICRNGCIAITGTGRIRR